MIYKLHEKSSVLNENTLQLSASSITKIKEYKFHILSGETKQHGPRIKVMFKNVVVGYYRVNIHTGGITMISCDITPNHRSPLEDAVREVSYACYKLIYKISKDYTKSDIDLMQYYVDLIVGSPRYKMHDMAERIRTELNDKIS